MQLTAKIIITVLTVGAIMSSCKKSPEETAEVTSLDVKVLQVALTEVPTQFQFTGKVISDEKTLLSTKLLGTIEQIPDAGQKVRKGQLLVKVRNLELAAKLESAKASQKEAKAYLDNTQKNHERIQRLFEKGSATRKELDDIGTAYEMGKARLETVAQSIAELNEMMRYSRLMSPIDGFVSQKMSDVGDIASPGSPLLALESLEQLKVEINVPEFEIGKLYEKAPVVIKVAAMNGQLINGWVDKIVSSSEYSGSQYKVSIQFEEAVGLKPGMYAEITLLKGAEQKILIPENAIYRRGQLVGLYGVNHQNEAMLRWVRLGKTYSEGVEVLSGLNAGEQVIISSEGKLFDGAKVEVIN